MNLVNKLASEGHLTGGQVERIGDSVRDFMAAVEKDPALYKEALEKLAAPNPDSWLEILKGAFSRKNVGEGVQQAVKYVPFLLGTTAVGAALGGGAEAAKSGIRALRDRHQKGKAYSAMLEENPHLSDADPHTVEGAFNTLYRFNPAYAQDPLVAGTFVKNVIDQERIDIGTVGNLVQARKSMQDAKPKGPGALGFFMDAMQKAPEHATKQEQARQQAEQHDWAKEEASEKHFAAEAARRAAEAKQEAAEAERDWWQSPYVSGPPPKP